MNGLWEVLGGLCLSETFCDEMFLNAKYDPCANPRKPTAADQRKMQKFLQNNTTVTPSRSEVFTIHYIIASVGSKTFEELQRAWSNSGNYEPGMKDRRHYVSSVGLMCVDHEYRKDAVSIAKNTGSDPKNMLAFLQGTGGNRPKFDVTYAEAASVARFLKSQNIETLLGNVDQAWIQPGTCDPAYSFNSSAGKDYWPWWSQYMIWQRLDLIEDVVRRKYGKKFATKFRKVVEWLFSVNAECVRELTPEEASKLASSLTGFISPEFYEFFGGLVKGPFVDTAPDYPMFPDER